MSGFDKDGLDKNGREPDLSVLNPFATKLLFCAPDELSEDQWKNHISMFLEMLAVRCESILSPFVGHIKLIALFEEKRYFRANLVTPHHPVEFEGNLPDRIGRLSITLNVLVYGFTLSAIKMAVKTTKKEIEKRLESGIKFI